MVLRVSFLCLLLTLLFGFSNASFGGVFGSVDTPQIVSEDKPVPRGYIVPRAEPAQGGAKIIVDIYHRDPNSPVSLWLEAAIDNGSTPTIVPLIMLSDSVTDNPSYRSHREFFLNYAEWNSRLSQIAPQSPNLRFGVGTPLFVSARWVNTGHLWGGIARSGGIFLPAPLGSAEVAASQDNSSSVKSRNRPTVLDIAVPISQAMANLFNHDGGARGLKVQGQIRSRVEGEGKFQVALGHFASVRDALFALTRNGSLQSQVLGGDWKLTLVDRYLKRDANGQVITNEMGVPFPDPMTDTYHDDLLYRMAQNDMALRWRWTEGNQTGAWNFKPGMGNLSPEGVVYRLEYGVDTTDATPDTLAKFADSYHPLNFFSQIRQLIPGAIASQFFLPSVKITDFRYKFALTHRNGLVIEVSLDDVWAENLRWDSVQGAPVRAHFAQLEMDIEHLAATSQNTSTSLGGHSVSLQDRDTTFQSFGPHAFFEGRPVIHEKADLMQDSPVRLGRKSEFDLATQVIVALRTHLLGNNWIPGAQKYAFAAHLLNLSASNSYRQPHDSHSVALMLRAFRGLYGDVLAPLGEKIYESASGNRNLGGSVTSCGSLLAGN